MTLYIKDILNTGKYFCNPLEIKEYMGFHVYDNNDKLALLGKNDFEFSSCLKKS